MGFVVHRINKQHPTFLATVTPQGLVTDGVWWRTALSGEEYALVGLPLGGEQSSDAIRKARRIFNRPLFVDEGEGPQKYIDANSPLLGIRADQLTMQGTVECILLDHTTIHVPKGE